MATGTNRARSFAPKIAAAKARQKSTSKPSASGRGTNNGETRHALRKTTGDHAPRPDCVQATFTLRGRRFRRDDSHGQGHCDDDGLSLAAVGEGHDRVTD